MRLGTYEADGRPTVGVIREDGSVVDLHVAWPEGLGAAPTDMIDLIARWDDVGPRLAPAIAGASSSRSVAQIDASMAWLPPVPRPAHLFGVALNNAGFARLASVIPAHPMLFSYPTSALTGHLHPVEIARAYGLTHPEPELGVVISRQTRRIGVDDALSHVFGYTIVDDVTSVDLKSDDTVIIPRVAAQVIGGDTLGGQAPPPGFEHGDSTLTYHARSKGCDTFAPCGPWIVTRDSIPDPQNLKVTMSIDGEVCMEDHTGALVYSVAEVIAFASSYFTLEAGDIIHLGTAGARPAKRRLRDFDYQYIGDVRTIEIESIGALTNPVHRF